VSRLEVTSAERSAPAVALSRTEADDQTRPARPDRRGRGGHGRCPQERMDLRAIRIDKPDDLNFVLGQSHFIKTVEDLHEVLAQASPTLKFGIAFCESSGPRLIRRSGNDSDSF